MDIFGIGASELVFIILIAIIILGPKDMQKAGRTIGRWLNQLVRSDGWKVFQRTSSEIRNLPRNLMREANMEMMEAEKELRRAMDLRPNNIMPPSNKTENTAPSLPPSDSPSASGEDASNAEDGTKTANN
jgi:sec-independent protein translocase protein TatB